MPGATGSERPKGRRACLYTAADRQGIGRTSKGRNSRSAPSGRERPVVLLGVEGPHVEVLDAVPPVDVVQGSALAQRPAQQAASIAAGSAWMAPEQLGLSLSGQRSEAQKVGYLDATSDRSRSVVTQPYSHRRRRIDAMPTSDMRQLRWTVPAGPVTESAGGEEAFAPGERCGWRGQVVRC